MRNTWHDLETRCDVPLKNGTHAYAECAEVMLWAFADGDGDVMVWDLINRTFNYQDELSGIWVSEDLPDGDPPAQLAEILDDPEALMWFHNGGQFDFPVLSRALPDLLARVPMQRWRDTMVQAYSHSLPGALEKLGAALNISEDKRKLAEGKKLVRLFCMPQSEVFEAKWGARYATKQTHPSEWQRFIEYAGGDIVTMREAHRLMPTWNWRGKHIDLWHCDLRINMRGFAVDLDLARAAVAATDEAKASLARRTQELTGGQVSAATQRDQMLRYILSAHGIELPDMRADTLERRLEDETLPDAVKELIRVRLQASMNSASKYKAFLNGANSDRRLRGTQQFRGASRTGRVAHRLCQPGNMMRPTLEVETIERCIEWLKEGRLDAIEMSFAPLMEVLGNAVRGNIVAPPGKKLAVADLANIEGRVAAWLAGEESMLQAFRDYDTFLLDGQGQRIPGKKKDEFLRKGVDTYIKAYAASFNVDPVAVGKDERQIGKVQSLFFQYGGGVGAWLTGAATYGIDLDKMTEQVWPTLPDWSKDEAESFLNWLYEGAQKKHAKDIAAGRSAVEAQAELEASCLRARMGLTERTFIACDAIKRLWRKANPRISSYWSEIEETVRYCIANPNETMTCRRLKIRRSGAWLRVCLPSGRELCYVNPGIETKGARSGSIYYTGMDNMTRQWGKVYTYGGKFFEQCCQASACDQLIECLPIVEQEGYHTVLTIHDEMVCEVPDSPDYTAEGLATLMCSNLGWNEGLPLAAAGFETERYAKG